jgi:hypothetical protein
MERDEQEEGSGADHNMTEPTQWMPLSDMFSSCAASRKMATSPVSSIAGSHAPRAKRELEDGVAEARDGDERAGADVSELVEEGIHCCSETNTKTSAMERIRRTRRRLKAAREKVRVDQI